MPLCFSRARNIYNYFHLPLCLSSSYKKVNNCNNNQQQKTADSRSELLTVFSRIHMYQEVIRSYVRISLKAIYIYIYIERERERERFPLLKIIIKDGCFQTTLGINLLSFSEWSLSPDAASKVQCYL